MRPAAGENKEMKDQIREVIKHWWNDALRKTWKTDLADPTSRAKSFDELAEEIGKALEEK